MLRAILGRSDSFLSDDIEGCREAIEDIVSDARLLVIGAAGSIGAAFVREMCQYEPRGLHLLDISENNLVEVVRDLRGGGYHLPDDFKTFALDYSEVEMKALLEEYDYDYVLNFSALKHVRSERDRYTLMRLLNINVLANDQLLEWLRESKTLRRVFSVSSDKSVRPANLMGASKAFMERVCLAWSDKIEFASARFANVAFSDGSLLHGFGNRLLKQQPFSAPSDVRRYFITHQEAGQLCILGCFVGNNREICFPKFDPERDMLTFAEIAKVFLKEHGYTPVECDSEEEALAFMRDREEGSKEWACYFSSSDTAGEKLYEEFSDPVEPVDLERFKNVGVITDPIFPGGEIVRKSLSAIRDLRSKGSWTKDELLNYVQLAVPELNHMKTDKNLDQKM